MTDATPYAMRLDHIIQKLADRRAAEIETEIASCLRDGFRGWLEIEHGEPVYSSADEHIRSGLRFRRHDTRPVRARWGTTLLNMSSYLPTARA